MVFILQSFHVYTQRLLQDQLSLRLTAFFNFGLKNYISLHSSSKKNLFQDQIYSAHGFTYHHYWLLSLKKEAMPKLGSLENCEQGFSYALHIFLFCGEFPASSGRPSTAVSLKNWQEGNNLFAKLICECYNRKNVLQFSSLQVDTILQLF